MSKYQREAIALDDGYDDYDDDYEDEAGEGLTAEDREQLEAGTVAVRAELGTDFPATDKDIQDSLWQTYYDVAKTVTFLKNKQTAAQLKAKKKQAQTPVFVISCLEALNVQDFFADAPWLNVPASRRAQLIKETRHLPTGLLGGSAKGEKMSKLAALAAKRRQKENAEPPPTDQDSQPTTDDYTLSLQALRLATPATSKRKLSHVTSQDNTGAGSMQKSSVQIPVDKNPEKSSSITTDLQKEEVDFEPNDLKASPSPFASAILGSDTPIQSSNLESLVEHSLRNRQAQGFDFTAPSPDDVVTKAQAAKVKSPAKPVAKGPKKAKNSLSDGIGNLSIQDPVKVKSKNIDVIAEYGKLKHKNAANFVVIGHVDAGKSTLMGRLLFDLKAIDQRTIDRYKREAENIGKGSFAFAWVLDQGTEERARGVTIDIAMNNFETEKTKFTILDAPGHRDFVPNMIAGASQADFAVLVIDSTPGNFESGLKGQTKEHALLARSIGVQRIIVAVNKMDAAGWSEARFTEIQQQMTGFLTAAGFQSKNVSFVPCSGLQGDNILHKSTNPEASWYEGLSLVEELDNSEAHTYPLDAPLRIPIADVFRGGVQNPLSVSGRIEAGTVQPGEQIIIMPSSSLAAIKSLEVDDEPRDWAVAGQNVVLHLTEMDPAHLKVGDMLCSPTNPIANVTSFTAKLLAFDHLTPMLVTVHRGRLNVPARIATLVATLDKGSGAVLRKRPKIVQPGSVARVVVQLEQAVPLEAPARIVLRSGGETVAAGLVEKGPDLI